MTEATEKKKKKGPVRLSKDLHLWLLAEQRRREDDQLRSGNQEPKATPIWVLLDELWRRALTAGSQEAVSAPTGRKRRHDAELKMLEFILNEGTKKDAAGITVNLENFVEAIESRAPQSRKHGT